MYFSQSCGYVLKRGHLCKDAGQALVETAFSFSVILLLLLGAVELGRAAYAAIEIANAARAAAQFVTMGGGSFISNSSGQLSPNTTGMKNAAEADAPQVYAWNPSAFSVNASMACKCANGGTSTCTEGDCAGSFMLVTVTAQTQTTFKPLINLAGLGPTFTLKGQSVQEVLP